MKWLTDPPEDWSNAPEQPPSACPEVDVEQEHLDRGFVLRESGSETAYVYISDSSRTVSE